MNSGKSELSASDEQRIRELQGKTERTELEEMELDGLCLERVELAAARDAEAEAEAELEL